MNWEYLILIAVVAIVSGILGYVIGSHVIWLGKVVAAEEFRLLERD